MVPLLLELIFFLNLIFAGIRLIFYWSIEEKGTAEGKMVGWLHQLCGHEFEQAPGGREGQGGLPTAIRRVRGRHH